MFVRDGYFWRSVPMLSPDDAGGAPADGGTPANDDNGHPLLHFQLRKETAKLNPEVWIGR